MGIKTARLSICLTTFLTLVTVQADAAGTVTIEHKPSTTPQQVFDGMKHDFQADNAKGFYARYQWELSGPNGGEWWIEVDDGKCKIGRGRINRPSVTFIISDKDWVAMANGKLSGTWAYLTGRFKVRGSHAIARKLDEMFP